MNTSVLANRCGETTLQVQIHAPVLTGSLVVPRLAQHLIIFVQGDQNCSLNPRNRSLAATFNQQGFATLLLDLEPTEHHCVNEQEEWLHYDSLSLAMRLIQVTDYLISHYHTAHLKISYLGLQGGEEVAMVAASERAEKIRSVILLSCGTPNCLRILPYLKMPVLLFSKDEDLPEVTQYKRYKSMSAESSPDNHLRSFCDLGCLLYLSENSEFISRYIINWLV